MQFCVLMVQNGEIHSLPLVWLWATGQFNIGNKRPIFCANVSLSVPAPTVNHIHLILTCWLGIPLLPLWLSYAFKLQWLKNTYHIEGYNLNVNFLKHFLSEQHKNAATASLFPAWKMDKLWCNGTRLDWFEGAEGTSRLIDGRGKGKASHQVIVCCMHTHRQANPVPFKSLWV